MADSEMSPTVYWTLVGLFMATITIFVLVSTGSFTAVLALWILVAVVVGVLVYYGYVQLVPPKKDIPSTAPAPITTGGGPLVGSEVFHVADKSFTYDEAHAVCAAYDASLATLEQVIEAYNSGAEWCNYGWSAGGMALYPTQKATWDALQREIDPAKKTACGRPGVNGGYFDPMLKFGVNCFGFKPQGDFKGPAPLPGVDKTAFDAAVARFKDMLKSMTVVPFSRQEWSGYGKGDYGKQFTQSLGKLTESFTEYADEFSEATNTTNAAYTAGPYGLKGAQGPKGDVGPAGPMGPTGPKGTDGTVGPTGPKGDMGPTGAASTIAGPTGPRGTDGTSGLKGDPGPTGPKGDKTLPQILWASIGAPTQLNATGVKSPEQIDTTVWAKRALNPENNYNPPCDTNWWFGRGKIPEGMGSPIVCDTVYSISGDPANKKISRVANFQDALVRKNEIPFTTDTKMS